MTIHSKTRQRVRFLLIAFALLVVAGTSAYVVRKRQIADRIVRDREAGFAALEAGDYFNALHKIGPYLQKNPEDLPTLLKYANARRNVEEPNGKHLVEAIALYRRATELNPDNLEAQEQLLEIYLATGFNTEILAATEGKNDPPALRARALALANLKRDAEARTAVERYLTAKPGDLRMQMFAVSQMQRLGQSADEILDYVKKVVSSNPADPRYDLLTAFGYGVLDQREEALKFARKAAAQPMSDPEQVEIAVDMLDSLEREDEALAVLIRAAELGKDKKFQRKVIARLYQSRKYDLVTSRVTAADENKANFDSELLAHRAMALQAQNQRDDAQRTIAALASRKNDFAAAGWAGVLSALPGEQEQPDDRKIILASRDGLRGEADNPYFRLHLGDAYSRLGESELATIEWSRASSGARVWGEPLQRLLQVVILQGQPETLRLVAARLERLSPQDPRALAVIAAARARLTDRTNPAAVSELASLIDRVQTLQPGEPGTVQLKVSLLATTDRKAQAEQFIKDQLAADRKLQVESYIALSRASESNKLGMEQAVQKRCTEVHGITYDLAVAEAGRLIRAGNPADAIKSFAAAREKATDRDKPKWKLAEGLLLDETGDPRAAKLLAELADAEPADIAFQRAVLASKSVQSDRNLQRRLIDRLRDAIGEEGVGWRLAEAKWLLDGAVAITSVPEREREIVKATSLLNDMVQRYPDQLAVRILLTDCLIRLDKKADAVPHLTAAAGLAPGSFALASQLAALLQSTGDFERAKQYLEQAERILERSETAIASDDGPRDSVTTPRPLPGTAPDLSREQAWRMISSLHAQRGDTARAVEILRRFGGENKDVDLAMAEMLAARGELSDDLSRQLLEKPSLQSIEIVAEQYIRAGRLSDADGAIARLDAVEAKPGERELLRGIYKQRRGEHEAAIVDLAVACSALPTDPRGWRARTTSLLLLGRGDEAVKVAMQATAAVPDEMGLKQIAANGELIREISALPAMRPLAVSVVNTPADRDVAITALTIARTASGSGKTVFDTARELRPLADRATSVAALQYLMIDLYLSMQDFDEAIALATRAMALFPTDPLPAQRATVAMQAAGRWTEALSTARQWRARLTGSTRLADEAIAQALLATGDFSAVLQQLEPYTALAAENQEQWLTVIALRARALLELQRVADAEATLFPAIATSPGVRAATIQLAVEAVSDFDVARRWLNAAGDAMPKDAADERIMLAQATSELSARPNPPKELSAEVDARFRQVTELLAGNATADQWLRLAVIKEMKGDLDGAAEGYRAAIKLDAKQSTAKNNLAMILAGRGGDLAEALVLAEEAAQDKASPMVADYLDTLASVQKQAGRLDAAEAAARQAIELQPRNPALRANLVQILVEAKKTKPAREEMKQLETAAAEAGRLAGQLSTQIQALRKTVAELPDSE